MDGTPERIERLSPVKRAILELREMRAKLDAMERSKTEAIAVVGIGCRFPGGVNSPEACWRLLVDGEDAISEVPADRWAAQAYYDPDPDAPGKMSTRWGGFLQGVDLFDPGFFGIAPREAKSIDPQQRLLLEVSWEALEHAGQAAAKLMGSRAGVFIGIDTSDYAHLLLAGDPAAFDIYRATGISASTASGRLSYHLGLQGPSISVNTACSSSLVAVHLACQSLRNGECGMALAGGVNLLLSPQTTIILSKVRMLAGDGRCKTFDARADGFVRGEGCGIVVLKRLSDALAEGDNILALIRGSAVNQDGRSNGLTAPNRLAQEEILRAALANAGVEATQIDYVETHGTGTSLGDPIEVGALAAVLGEKRPKAKPLAIGSIKTNIGHLEAAAGVAGLIKVVLAVQHAEIPPHLHLREPNPYIPWDTIPIVVPTQRMPWPADQGRRLAGVSSFGFSGTNAHVVVEQAPESQPVPATLERPLHLLTLSAKSEKALEELAQRYEQRLAAHPTESLADVCYTANAGRSHFTSRLAVLAEAKGQLREQLAAFASGQAPGAMLREKGRVTGPLPVVFLFTGQGAQYVGMGRQLYNTEPTFRETLHRCDALLRPYFEQSLLSVLYSAPADASSVDQTAYTQPALFAIEYALAELWRSWGIEPTLVMGHSVGEYVAACVAGVFSLEDGLKLIAERGRLMQALPHDGTMAAVYAPEKQVRLLLVRCAEAVDIAAINGPAHVTISGQSGVVRSVCHRLAAEGIKAQQLTVSHAFHSALMEPMLDEFEAVAKTVAFRAPRIGLVSNVTGQLLADGDVPDAAYWRAHVRQPVCFASAMQMLYEQRYQLFVEVGPGTTLLGMGRHCVPDGYGVWLPSLRMGREDWQQLLMSLAQLYVQGVDVDWAGFDRSYGRRRVSLPTYPFQRQRYWLEPPQGNAQTAASARSLSHSPFRPSDRPLLGERLCSPLPTFESHLSMASSPFLADYRIEGVAVVPATVYAEMAISAASEVMGPGTFTLHDVVFHEPLILADDATWTMQVILHPKSAEQADFQVFSARSGGEGEAQDSWCLHAAGKVQSGGAEARDGTGVAATEQVAELIATAQQQCESQMSGKVYYQSLEQGGVQYGPSFQGIERLWLAQGRALGRLRLPEMMASANGYQVHHILLESCFQLLMAEVSSRRPGIIYMPKSVQSLRVYRPVGAQVWGHVELRQVKASQDQPLLADLLLVDDSGRRLAEATGVSLKPLDPQVLHRVMQHRLGDWFYEIEWRPKVRRDKGTLALPVNDLPSLVALAEPLHAREAQLSSEHGLDQYLELLPRFDVLSAAYVKETFEKLGFQFRLHERFTVDGLTQQLGVVDAYHRLLGRLLMILREEGVLRQAGTEWEVCMLPVMDDAHKLLHALREQYPAYEAQLTLMGLCGPHIPDVMRGECDALELLFTDKAVTALEKLYKDAPYSRVYNTLIQEAISAALEHLPKGVVRILEIGAGTGSTTSYVLPKLPIDRTHYVFTDISRAFMSKAREKFRDYAFMRYDVLNIEEDPRGQGFSPYQFDLILAANVLHATKDLRQTMQHVRQLLVPGGFLVLLEATGPNRWVDLVFGLTDGWWRFQDTNLRPTYPVLAAKQWLTLLEELEFTEAAIVPKVKPSQAHVGQVMVLARSAPVDQDVAQRESVALLQPGSWLIFSDAEGIGENFAERLSTVGQTCVTIQLGRSYEQVSDGHFQINPSQPEDFARVVRVALHPGRPPCRAIVYLWGLGTVRPQEATVASLEADQEAICGSVLHLVQALAAGEISQPRSLWIVTRQTQPVGRGPVSLAVAQTPLWGLGRVIASEHPEFWGGLVDLDGSSNPRDSASRLFEEISSPDGEDQVAYRNEDRYAARLVPSKGKGSATPKLCWRADGTYLITGGLGGLGLRVASWLVQHGARYLVLVGRSTPSQAALEIVRALEAAGAQVAVVRADVSQEQEVVKILQDIQSSMPPLRGIMHAAGIVDHATLIHQQWERFAKVFAAKVQGTWNLHTLTRNMELDCFVLFSTAASLLGLAGQGSHAAANAFLDAMAHYRRAQGLPALSINWGPWSEVGAASQSALLELFATWGVSAMTTQQGLGALEAALQCSTAQVAVLPIVWSQFLEQVPTSSMLFADFRQHLGPVLEQRSEILQMLKAAPPNRRRRLLESSVRALVAKVLGIDPSQLIDLRQGFFELGMDSLTSMELRKRLQTYLGRTLPSTLTFDYPTPEALVHYLAQEMLVSEFASEAVAVPA